jgi:hypothetical protein
MRFVTRGYYEVIVIRLVVTYETTMSMNFVVVLLIPLSVY